MKQLFNFYSLIFIAILATGCNGCDPAAQLNNGNDSPETLIIEIYGADVANPIRFENLGCEQSSTFTATVEILVRTASFINGEVVPDPDPYFQYDNDDINFYSFVSTTFPVSVPETGAYAIFIEIELDSCSNCCHGSGDIQCSWESYESGGIWYCISGKPQVAIEYAFTEEARPEYNLNWNPSNILVRECRACGCITECN